MPDPETRPNRHFRRTETETRRSLSHVPGPIWCQARGHAPKGRARSSAELRGVCRLAVPPGVAVLAAYHDQHEILVADADDLARRRRLYVTEPAWPELPRLAWQQEARPPAMHEIELVLFLVGVRPRGDPGREHPSVGAEGSDPERRPNLADDAVSELDGITPLARDTRDTHALHLYVIRIDPDRAGATRDEYQRALGEQLISTSIHFLPVHMLTWYHDRFPASLPVAERAGAEVLSLPLSPAHSDDDIRDAIDALRRVHERFSA